MSVSQVESIIKQAYGDDITNHLLSSFKEIEENFVIKKWKPSELNAGHFVESVRRILEFELSGNYTPYGQNLSNFNDQTIRQYEQAQGHESFRMLIPRTLKSIYNIRNKRGVGHVGPVLPNKMDASFILSSVKWILAELIRLKSNLSPDDTLALINQISDRNIELLWDTDGLRRVLNSKIPAKEQVLILLFDKSPCHIEELRNAIEYKNAPNFRKLVVGKLHGERFIELNQENGICSISPTGTIRAEELIIKYVNI